MQSDQPKRLVIVGARGYIGSQLLARQEVGVEILGTSTSGASGLIQLDLRAPQDFDFSLISTGDSVVLTAAISNPDRCAKEFEDSRRTNVIGSSEFVDRAIDRGANVLFLSSDAVYGNTPEAVDEDAPCNPLGAYATMKLELEERYRCSENFKSARLSYVFSHDDKFTQYLLGCAKSNTTAEIYHPFYRNVIHRGDVVDGLFIMCMDWNKIDSQVINFGGPDLVSRIDMLTALNKYGKCSIGMTQTEPGADFFRERPRLIHMKSNRLAKALGRQLRTFKDAVMHEFSIGE